MVALGASLAAVESAQPSGWIPADIVNTGPPVGWKSVQVDGLMISVPGSWAKVRGGPFDPCGPPTPTIFVSPSSAEKLSCTTGPNLVAEVVVSSKFVLTMPHKAGRTYSTAVTTAEAATINHVPLHLRVAYRCFHPKVSPNATDCFTAILVTPAHYAFKISIRVGDSPRFPGGARGRATQIVDSIRRAS